jgi:hypothetical protein
MAQYVLEIAVWLAYGTVAYILNYDFSCFHG